jgi:hypothetical protein
MPASVSVGIGELSWTLAEPSTETWVGVIGNPNFSKVGNSDASAVSPPSRTSVMLVIERSLRMLSSIWLRWLSGQAMLPPLLHPHRPATCLALEPIFQSDRRQVGELKDAGGGEKVDGPTWRTSGTGNELERGVPFYTHRESPNQISGEIACELVARQHRSII